MHNNTVKTKGSRFAILLTVLLVSVIVPPVLDLQATEFVTVTGTVTENGVPLDGALVSIYPAGGITTNVYTDANGQYTHQAQSGASLGITARAPDGTWIGTQVGITGAPGETIELNFNLVPGTVTGTVTENGVPLEGAKVYLYPTGGITMNTDTDANGQYTQRVQSGVALIITANAPDGTWIGTQVGITAAPGETIVLSFNLISSIVTGTVTENGVPLEGAKVSIYPTGGITMKTYTDANGEFTQRVQSGVALIITANAPDGTWIGTQVGITAAPGETIELNFNLVPGTVTGTVTENGVPLEGAKVSIYPTGGITMKTYTDANGQYTQRVQSGVAHSITANAPDGTWIGSQGGVTVGPGENLVVDFDSGSNNNTPVGDNIPVVPIDPETGEPSPVTITFEEVTTAGSTTVTTSSTGPFIPTQLKLGNPPIYFDINTDAQYQPPLTVCIDYSGITFGNENQLTLLHWDGNGWEDITTSIDTENDTICGEVSGLSVFVIVEPNLPLAHAGPDQSVYVGDLVTLDGSNSWDPDGDALTFSWAFLSFPAGSIVNLDNPTSVNPTFTIDIAGTYVVSLTVNDGTLDSEPDTVTISTINVAPIADAGPDRSVYVGDLVTLDGSNSWDPDGDPLTFSWAFTSLPTGSMATLDNSASVNPTFTVDAAGTYVVSLTVNDGIVDSELDTLIISTINVAPIADAGLDQSVYVGDLVTLDGSNSQDPDGDPLTFSWAFTSLPTGSMAILNNPTALHPTFAADVTGSYVVSLTVNDGTVDSEPDKITISAVTQQTEVIAKVQELIAAINGLEPGKFNNPNNKKTLTNKLNAVIEKLENCEYQDALKKLENDVLKKTDGCALTGNPHNNDWIMDCNSQAVVYPLLMDAIELLTLLI